jgi:hypothetical protein
VDEGRQVNHIKIFACIVITALLALVGLLKFLGKAAEYGFWVVQKVSGVGQSQIALSIAKGVAAPDMTFVKFLDWTTWIALIAGLGVALALFVPGAKLYVKYCLYLMLCLALLLFVSIVGQSFWQLGFDLFAVGAFLGKRSDSLVTLAVQVILLAIAARLLDSDLNAKAIHSA